MNNGKLSYRYSFNCSDHIQNFDIFPENIQVKIEKYIVNVIADSFIQPADEDYVLARFMAHNGMHRAFFWAAAQALEKYLKAYLLMRGISVNHNSFKGHPIAALHAEACLADGKIANINVAPHKSINIDPNIADLIENYTVEKFIKDVEVQGSPDNRYNSFGITFNPGYLFALDSYIAGLRQNIGVPPIEQFIRKINDCIVGEFYKNNPWFAQERIDLENFSNNNFKFNISMAVTTLDYLTGPRPPYESKSVLQWLDKKMKLPLKIKNYLNER